MLRADLVFKKEELEKERCQHREVQAKLRELEMKFEGLTAHTNMVIINLILFATKSIIIYFQIKIIDNKYV